MFSRLRLSFDQSVTASNLLDELLRRTGDRLVGYEDDRPRHLSDLHADVCSLSRFLIESAGLEPGGLVAIYRTNDTRCFRWFLAVIRAGGIAVPLNPLLSLAEVQRISATSGAKILVTDRAVFERTIGSRDALPFDQWIQDDSAATTLDGFLRPPPIGSATPFEAAHIEPDTTVAIFHTSGTSGFPKGAALSSRALLGGRATAALVAPFLGSKDLALIALPWSHIMAVSIAIYGLFSGVPGCFLEHFDTARALDIIERRRITTFAGVPAMMAKLVNANPSKQQLSSIRVWLSASDHLPVSVRRRMREYGALFRLPFGRRVRPLLLNAYGMVELGGIAMLGVDASFLPGDGDLCLPIPRFKIRIADESGHPVPSGTVGECLVKGPGLSPGYWNDPDRSATLLNAGQWMRTGDLAVRNRLGMIRLAGRAKDVIKCGGYSVYARELEEAMAAHPAVARAAAFGVPHAEKGEVPVGVIELRVHGGAVEQDLLLWCRDRLAVYKAPRRIHILPPGAMPQGVTWKVLKSVLFERFAGSPIQ
jgi:acyl-CoA synthetase (AMP-forming)/AMP-acid ligase II